MTYYETLEVAIDADPTKIRKAFIRLSLQYHPDKNPNTEEKYKGIVKAYEVLSDPVKRKEYDKKQRIYAGLNDYNDNIDSTINPENFLEIIRSADLLSRHKLRQWWSHLINNINDRQKIIESINTMEQLSFIAETLYPFEDYNDTFLTPFLTSKGLHRCVHTMDDFLFVMDSNWIGSAKDQLFNEFRNQFSMLIQKGLFKNEETLLVIVERIRHKENLFQLLCSLEEEELLKIISENEETLMKIYDDGSDFLNLYRPNERHSDATHATQYLVLAQHLFFTPWSLVGQTHHIQTFPAVVALFFLKRVPKNELGDKLKDILSWPAFSSEENRIYRDELLSYYFENLTDNKHGYYTQIDLFNTLFFQLNPEVRAHFLDVIKEKEMESNTSRVRFWVYTACQKTSPEEKEFAIRSISYESQSDFFSNLPEDMSTNDVKILADIYIKSPDILNHIIANSFDYICSPIYSDILKSMKSEVIHLSKSSDGFMTELDQKIAYYENQYKRAKKDSEDQTLYAEIKAIFITERNQYAVSARDEASRHRCKETIAHYTKQISTTLRINDTLVDRMSKTLGFKQDEGATKKFRLSENMPVFMKHQNTQVVKDLMSACGEVKTEKPSDIIGFRSSFTRL